MSFTRWLRNLTSARRPGITTGDGRAPARPGPAARFRPRLEALEDRLVPSLVPVFRQGDDVNEMGTLRWAVAHAQNLDTIGILPTITTPIALTNGELVINNYKN